MNHIFNYCTVFGKQHLLLILCIFNFLIINCGAVPKLPERGICAHRGANLSHPENTLAAFREAIRLGAHMIEFDVRLSKDGELVIIHDKTVDRTTDGQGKVSELTLTQLKRLDAGSWKNPEFAGERLPTLSEALAIMPENIWLNVHLKGKAELGEKAARMIVSEGRLHQAFLACKTAATAAARAVDSRIKICSMERRDNSAVYVDETITMKADFIQLKERADATLPELTKKLRENGIRINYYGTSSPDKLKKLFAAGVDFPLVDELVPMLKAAQELSIKPVKPAVK